MNVFQTLENDERILRWTGPVAFVVSIALLAAAPVIFVQLFAAAERDAESKRRGLENRIIQCDNNAMLRRMLGITDSLPICTEPHEVPHR